MKNQTIDQTIQQINQELQNYKTLLHNNNQKPTTYTHNNPNPTPNPTPQGVYVSVVRGAYIVGSSYVLPRGVKGGD